MSFRATSRKEELHPKTCSALFERSLGKILATLPDELENRLREHLRKQVNLSRIVSEALASYLDAQGAHAAR